MAARCERCGSPGSPSGAPSSCAACQLPAWSTPDALTAAASWLPTADRGNRRRSLGAILLGYRHAGRLTQQHLADLLGFDRSYISMIERGRRNVTDHGTLAHIARVLAIPPHLLGIADPEDADFTGTGRALRIAWNLGDRELLASVLRMHGNELRKAGYAAAGIIRLRQSLQIDDHPGRRSAGLLLLARAAAESGQAELFDTAIEECVRVLRARAEQEIVFNSFTVREVRLRGLLATGRTGQAVDLADNLAVGDKPPTPQWRVIERITIADVLATAGDQPAAAGMLSAALGEAETLRLPHQVQRMIRMTGLPGFLSGATLRAQAETALTRLDRQLTETTSATGAPASR